MANSQTAGSGASTGLSENIAHALCYVFGILSGVAFLVIAPYNQNRLTRFHAFQSICFSAGALAASIALSIAGVILGSLLGMVFSIVSMVAMLGVFAIWVFLVWKAYQGETVVLPVVGRFAREFSNR